MGTSKVFRDLGDSLNLCLLFSFSSTEATDTGSRVKFHDYDELMMQRLAADS